LYGRAFFGGEIREGVLVSFDSQFTSVTEERRKPKDAEAVDGLIAPGFIDMHVHGGDGADFMDGSDEAAARIARFHARNGTTAMAATTLSASKHDLAAAVQTIARVAREGFDDPAAEVCGVHLEGPYINARRAGAQDVASIRPADIHEMAALLADIKHIRCIITLAPELEGARALIEHFRDRVLFSIGHTAADFSEAVAALAWGASHFTHLFNAMTGMHHREPGAVGAALESQTATAELIADGIHVHPAVLRIATMAMPGRIALITDAVRACGMPDGSYKLYDHEFTVADGAARLADGTLAGSVLTMMRAVENMVELAGLPIEMVLPLATEVPARLLGVAGRKGRIARGYDADVVVFNEKFGLTRVFARGREVPLT
jgi:N-acetylglucosamine-6-phosphate deacetylase